jgi:hypothetical protein
MTELEHPVDFMAVKHMPDRLTWLECLKARIWVGLMTVPASGIRESSPPGRFPDVSETAKPLDVGRDVLCHRGKLDAGTGRGPAGQQRCPLPSWKARHDPKNGDDCTT